MIFFLISVTSVKYELFMQVPYCSMKVFFFLNLKNSPKLTLQMEEGCCKAVITSFCIPNVGFTKTPKQTGSLPPFPCDTHNNKQEMERHSLNESKKKFKKQLFNENYTINLTVVFSLLEKKIFCLNIFS